MLICGIARIVVQRWKVRENKMAQNVNMIIDCDYTSCPYNYEHECGKDVLYVDDSECIAQKESEG